MDIIYTAMIKNVLGIMSGSSLDGLDLALLTISFSSPTYSYTLLKTQTIPYPPSILQLLSSMPHLTILQYLSADRTYTKFFCSSILSFLPPNHPVDLISTHGHTIFHQPENGFTLQCGDPVMIAAVTGIDTVGNFRLLDVYRGGQGAPLVPYGSEIFREWQGEGKGKGRIDAYLNLGGICNIDAGREGWDVGFCNMFGNRLAEEVGMKYDEDGKLGESGEINQKLLEIFRKEGEVYRNMKSLGREHFDEFISKISNYSLELSVNDQLRTYYQYLSQAILSNLSRLLKLPSAQKPIVLCTGGGAYNKFLLHLLNTSPHLTFILPPPQIIEFKEAIIFALLGFKNIQNIQNCKNGVGGVFVRGTKVTETNNKPELQNQK